MQILSPSHNGQQGTAKERIGWIGVGAMGQPMCLNLLAAGYDLTVYDKQRGRLDAVCEAGAVSAGSPREVASMVDIVFSTVFDDDDLRAIVLGSQGIVAATRRAGQIYIDMSTVSPGASAQIAEALAHRVLYLRAPVSGTVSLAASAQLSTFVSGPRDAYDRVRPILCSISARQAHVGLEEEARVLKLLINLLVFAHTAAIGEALSFGARAGLDRATMVDAINDSIVGSPHYRAKADKLKQREYSPAGSIALVTKDMDLALHVASRSGTPLPISSLVRQYLAMLQSRGLADLDVAVLAEVVELSTGHVDADAITTRKTADPHTASPRAA